MIAADGIKSSIRDHVLNGLGQPLVAPRFSGTCAYRGMIDSQQLRTAYRARGVDEHLVDVPQMYLGLDAHILTFPVKQGRLINVVAFISDRSRPDPTWPSDSPWVRNASQEEMLSAFNHWGDAARVLLECIPAPTLWALHELDELPGYVHGRAGLIGDAAHAMLPHQGAGAGQGLEDAWLLARLLADPQVMDSQPQAVLEAYDAIRRPRACRVQPHPGKPGSFMNCVIQLYPTTNNYWGKPSQSVSTGCGITICSPTFKRLVPSWVGEPLPNDLNQHARREHPAALFVRECMVVQDQLNNRQRRQMQADARSTPIDCSFETR